MIYDYLLPISTEELEAIHEAPGISAELTRRAMDKEQALKATKMSEQGFGWTTIQVALDRLFGDNE